MTDKKQAQADWALTEAYRLQVAAALRRRIAANPTGSHPQRILLQMLVSASSLLGRPVQGDTQRPQGATQAGENFDPDW